MRTRRPSGRQGVGLILLALATLIIVAPALAADPPAASDLARAGGYCITCHSADDARLVAPLTWNGHLTREAYSPCPTVRQLRQEIFYIDDAFDAIKNGIGPDAAREVSKTGSAARLLAREESLPRLFETPYRSLDAGVNQARLLRFQLNKNYAQVQVTRQAWTNQVMLVVGVLVTLFLLVSLGWGLWNTRHLKGSLLSAFRVGVGSLVFLSIVFVIFALPIFNPPTLNANIATAQDTARQAALDRGTRAAASAENQAAKAWELTRLAVVDKNGASLALTAALSATNELETNAGAYWGRARELEESAVTWVKAADAAPPVVQRIQTAASRVWAFAAMADEVATSDPSRAKALLVTATARAAHNPDHYFRDLDLKKIAVAWGHWDRTQAVTTANQIQDALVRAWALREMGEFDAAAASARQVDDVPLRVFALREIALASKNIRVLSEAQTLAHSLPIPARAYALADLVAAWALLDVQQASQVANSIPAAYTDARASAFRRAGLYAQAWSELDKFAPGFEKARAQAELVSAWMRVSPSEAASKAASIQDAFWSDEASRAEVIALAKTQPARALESALAIENPFVRLQALSDLARATRDPASFQQAAALADQLHDYYPLRDLSAGWAEVEPLQALALVDKMDREGDRAQALLAVAISLARSDRTQANAVFDRAVKQAQAARVTGDPLYSTELLRELGTRYAAVDVAKANEAFSAALDAATKVTTAF